MSRASQFSIFVRVVIVSFCTAGAAHAQGFFINQQSVRGLGRADAGNVASANDPATLFFNPAGMTELWTNKGRTGEDSSRLKTEFNFPIIMPRSNLINRGSSAGTPANLFAAVPITGPDARDPADPKYSPVFNGYLARRINEDLSFGVALNSPFGLAEKYDSSWWGRYDTIKARLLTLNIAPTVAYRIGDKISAGGGLNIEYAKSELTAAIPDPFAPSGPSASSDGLFAVKGHDTGFGFNAGFLIKPSEKLRIGFHYRHSINHEIRGTATTSGLTGLLAPLNGSTGAKADLNLPKIAAIGAAWEATTQLTILADMTGFGWQSFEVTRIRFDNGFPDSVRTPNFRNTFGISGGAEYELKDKPFVVRAGVKVDRSPTRDGFRDTTFADDNRFWVNGGLTYNKSKTFAIDIAFTHVFVSNTLVDVVRDFSPLGIRVRGDVTSMVQTFAVGIRYSR